MIYVLSHVPYWQYDRERFLYETHFDLGDCLEFETVIKRLVRFRRGSEAGYFTIIQKFDCAADQLSRGESARSRQNVRYTMRAAGVTGYYSLAGELSCPELGEVVDGNAWRTLFADIGISATAELFWQWSVGVGGTDYRGRVARMRGIQVGAY